MEALAYLAGATHDSTFSRAHKTTRFCQNDVRWLQAIAAVLERLGCRSWLYREGSHRSVWVLETSWVKPHLILEEASARAAYVRGYFDSEGGIPKAVDARFYLQLVQKDLADLTHLRMTTISLGIDCGRIHNPSRRVDPHYWRFYVRASSHEAFIRSIGSWHERKRIRLSAELRRRCSSGTD
jgi:hypothetical protein